jgi:tetratricopeptide (TPR) repeat protein
MNKTKKNIINRAKESLSQNINFNSYININNCSMEDTENILKQAYQYYSEKNYEAAFVYYGGSEYNRKELDVAACLIKMKKNDAAISLLDSYLGKNYEEKAYAFLLKAYAYTFMEKFNKALECFEISLSEDKAMISPNDYLLLSVILNGLGRTKEAIKLLENVSFIKDVKAELYRIRNIETLKHFNGVLVLKPKYRVSKY